MCPCTKRMARRWKTVQGGPEKLRVENNSVCFLKAFTSWGIISESQMIIIAD